MLGDPDVISNWGSRDLGVSCPTPLTLVSLRTRYIVGAEHPISLSGREHHSS